MDYLIQFQVIKICVHEYYTSNLNSGKLYIEMNTQKET